MLGTRLSTGMGRLLYHPSLPREHYCVWGLSGGLQTIPIIGQPLGQVVCELPRGSVQ